MNISSPRSRKRTVAAQFHPAFSRKHPVEDEKGEPLWPASALSASSALPTAITSWPRRSIKRCKVTTAVGVVFDKQDFHL